MRTVTVSKKKTSGSWDDPELKKILFFFENIFFVRFLNFVCSRAKMITTYAPSQFDFGKTKLEHPRRRWKLDEIPEQNGPEPEKKKFWEPKMLNGLTIVDGWGLKMLVLN